MCQGIIAAVSRFHAWFMPNSNHRVPELAALNLATEKIIISQKALETSKSNSERATESNAAVQQQFTALEADAMAIDVKAKPLVGHYLR